MNSNAGHYVYGMRRSAGRQLALHTEITVAKNNPGIAIKNPLKNENTATITFCLMEHLQVNAGLLLTQTPQNCMFVCLIFQFNVLRPVSNVRKIR